MIDFLMALWGRKHCGWCIDKPHNFMDRHFGGYINEQPRWKNWVYSVWSFDTHTTRIWRFAERYHYKHHVGPRT